MLAPAMFLGAFLLQQVFILGEAGLSHWLRDWRTPALVTFATFVLLGLGLVATGFGPDLWPISSDINFHRVFVRWLTLGSVSWFIAFPLTDLVLWPIPDVWIPPSANNIVFSFTHFLCTIAAGAIQCVAFGRFLGRRFAWTMATVVGLGAAVNVTSFLATTAWFSLGFIPQTGYAQPLYLPWQAPLFDGLPAGLAIGLMQWLVLRREMRSAHWWILATVVGFMATAAPTVAADFEPIGVRPLYSAIAWLVAAPILAAATGTALMFMLRKTWPREPNISSTSSLTRA